jgi:hypothetical protein
MTSLEVLLFGIYAVLLIVVLGACVLLQRSVAEMRIHLIRQGTGRQLGRSFRPTNPEKFCLVLLLSPSCGSCTALFEEASANLDVLLGVQFVSNVVGLSASPLPWLIPSLSTIPVFIDSQSVDAFGQPITPSLLVVDGAGIVTRSFPVGSFREVLEIAMSLNSMLLTDTRLVSPTL